MGIKIHKSNRSWQPPHNSPAKVNKTNQSTSLLDLVKSRTNFTEDGKYHGLPRNALFDSFKRSRQQQNLLGNPDSVQPKLTIGQPGDKYEQEADLMAERVMKADKPVPEQNVPETGRKVRPPSLIQLSSDFINFKEKEAIQAKSKVRSNLKNLPLSDKKVRPPSLIQLSSDFTGSSEEKIIETKSKVRSNLKNLPLSDKKVRPPSLIQLSSDFINFKEKKSVEAKANTQSNLENLPLADKKVRPPSLIQLSSDFVNSSDEKIIEAKSNVRSNLKKSLLSDRFVRPPSLIQLSSDFINFKEKKSIEAKANTQSNLEEIASSDRSEAILQQKTADNSVNPDTEALETKLNNTIGGGSPLPEETKGFMESRFGADFSDVRIHDDSTAASMNQSIQAQAFTQGKDIYFNSGKYSPNSHRGKSLIAHELTHVLQQRGDEIAPKEAKQSTLDPTPSETKDSQQNSPPTPQKDGISQLLIGILSMAIGTEEAKSFVENIKADPQNAPQKLAELTPLIEKTLPAKAIAQIGELLDRLVNSYLGEDKQKEPTSETENNQSTVEEKEVKDPVEAFKNAAKIKALKQLEENRQLVLNAQAQYSEESETTTNLVSRLREAEKADRQLADRQKELEKRTKSLSSLVGVGQRNYEVYKNRGETRLAEDQLRVNNQRKTQLDTFTAKLTEAKQLRVTLLALYPATGVLKTGDVKENKDDAAVIRKLNEGFKNILSDIDKTREGVINGDVPITKLGAIVSQTQNEIEGEEAKAAVERYLERERTRDNIISLSLFALEIGLTIAALCTGGIAGAILLGLGTTLGIGSAVYEFEEADDLNRAANTGKAGGNQLVDDPAAARFNYLMGAVNLFLAGVDSILLVGEVGSLLKGVKSAEKILNLPGADEVFSRLSPEQIQKLDRVLQLEKAGDTNQAQELLQQIKGEVGGDTDVDRALDLLKQTDKIQNLTPAAASRYKSVTNFFGEVHEIKLLPDGRLFRCSDPCVEAAANFGQRLRKLSKQPSLSERAEELNQRIQKLHRASRDLAEEEQNLFSGANKLTPEQQNLKLQEIELQQKQLIDEAGSLEYQISKLEYESEGRRLIQDSKLGSQGKAEQIKSYQELIDTRELIDRDPQYRKLYSEEVGEVEELWRARAIAAKDETNTRGLMAEFKDIRSYLRGIRDETARELLEPKLKELDELNLEIKAKAAQEREIFRSWDRAKKAGRPQANDLFEQYKLRLKERISLQKERHALEEEIKKIEKLQNRELFSSATDRFADDITPQEALKQLIDSQSGRDRSLKLYTDMLVREKIISSQDDLIPVITQIDPKGKTIDSVRHAVKENYRSIVLDRMTAPDINKMQQLYPKLPWQNNPTKAYDMARHQEMMRIVDKLNPADRGNLAEVWYEKVYAKGRGSTQVFVSQEDLSKQGIAISQDRKPDEIFSDTIREQKTIKNKLKSGNKLKGERDELKQFEDYIKLVDNNAVIKASNKTYTVNNLIYTFTDPRGVKKNAKWMYAKLSDHKNLSFEIFNSQGELKIIDRTNMNDLKDPTLSNWLGF